MEQILKAISESVYARGKHGTLYVRRRIPAARKTWVMAFFQRAMQHVALTYSIDASLPNPNCSDLENLRWMAGKGRRTSTHNARTDSGLRWD